MDFRQPDSPSNSELPLKKRLLELQRESDTPKRSKSKESFKRPQTQSDSSSSSNSSGESLIADSPPEIPDFENMRINSHSSSVAEHLEGSSIERNQTVPEVEFQVAMDPEVFGKVYIHLHKIIKLCSEVPDLRALVWEAQKMYKWIQALHQDIIFPVKKD